MDSWIPEGPQNHEAADTQSPAGLARTNVVTWESPQLASLKEQHSVDTRSLSRRPSNSGCPDPLFYQGGANAHEAKRLLTHTQVDWQLKRKLIPGGWFLSNGVLEGKGDCGMRSHNPILSICLVQATQTAAIDS